MAAVMAVLVGLTTSKFIEGAGQAYLNNAPILTEGTVSVTLSYQMLVLFSWGVGAFAAAAIALWLGKRWAPLGGLGAASVGLSALLALSTFPLSWWMWPGAALVIGAGGFAAVKLLRAKNEYPGKISNHGLF